jgi:hypothetical protein
VLNRLESHWEIAGPLPPVRVSLSRTHSYETTDPGQSLWLPLRARSLWTRLLSRSP